jgi:transposase
MYDNYIAVDYSQQNMAIAKMTNRSDRIVTKDVPSNIKELQLYLSQTEGRSILTIEETTTSQWLYTELKGYVEQILVCDPYRNRLLSDGPKTDKIDAANLVVLLKGNLLKPVFHSGEDFYHLRKIVSGYEDVVKAGVRAQNQRAGLLRGIGKNKATKVLEDPHERFILEGIDKAIDLYLQEKQRYQEEFHRAWKEYPSVRNLESLPGVGEIGAVKIAARVVDARRFEDRGHFLSYCGLIKLEKISGGRSYGRRDPRYCRTLKSVFKTAALTAISAEGSNPFAEYYSHLVEEKNYAPHNARHKVARRIATVAYGILKTEKRFNKEKLFRGKTRQKI